MNRRSFLGFFGALSALTAFKPFSPKATPQPANDVWNYAQSVAGGTLLEMTITSPGGEGYCIVRDIYDNVGHGLGHTPQEALDKALSYLP